MLSFIKELEKQNPNEYLYTIPISDITDKFPILDKIWKEYKGMCNYGCEVEKQTLLLHDMVNKNKHLKLMRDEVMKYPNKLKYDIFERFTCVKSNNETIEQFDPIILKYNNVWDLRNAKYQHLINNMSFPNYYWRENELNKLKSLGIDARGNFFYPKGSFREWHTNKIHTRGYRMYFVACSENNKSWFNYVHPDTDKVVNVPDKNEFANIFYVNTDNDKAFWHSIYSETNRFSLGFNIYD